MLRHLCAAREAASSAEGVAIKPLSPSEKRILITKAVTEEHGCIIGSDACQHGFLVTGTWLPVSHLMEDADGNVDEVATISEEARVSLQHLSEYRYHDGAINKCSI
mmetsp:Transcript_294/g.582  ORF Transcript_294/g.582 Transcript_294/m.582 type:complete len:106 (+) Transcript_294:248-565(+)